MFPFPQSQSLMQAYFAEREEERREMRRLVEAAAGQNAARKGGGDKNSIGRARMGRDVSQSMQTVLCTIFCKLSVHLRIVTS